MKNKVVHKRLHHAHKVQIVQPLELRTSRWIAWTKWGQSPGLHGLHGLHGLPYISSCGDMSRIVFQNFVVDIETLCVRVTSCISNMTRDMLANTWI